ncbi:SHOCT domain-containing protein [Mesorhizobium sp. WSM4312]
MLSTISGINPRATVHAASLDILDRRYASGEITREQYEQMKGDLKRH